MVKIFRHKLEKARGLARQQKFDLALAEYHAAIAQAEAAGDAAALRNLYNAVGDALLQKNDAASAVEYFEKAIDSYIEEGLFDNAIALCHKILRNVPARAEVYAKLGRAYAEKGLRNESIQNWLEFAERREKAGDIPAVIRALREVLTLSPDLDVVRLQLAESLLSHGQARDAVVELEELRRGAEAAGDSARADELADRIAAVRQEHGIEEPGQAIRAGAEAGTELGAAPGEVAAEGLEPVTELEADRLSGAGAPAAGRLPEVESGFGFSIESPTLAPPPSAGAEPPVEHPTGFTPSAAHEPATLETPAAELPPLVAPFTHVPVEERIARSEARLAEDPADAEERIYLAELYQESGAVDLARAAMEQGASELFQWGQLEKAYRAYRRLTLLVPDEVEAVQKLVEVAQATGSRDYLLESYELLADRLMEAGHYGRAAEIYRRVLAIDPAHRHSQDQLLIVDGLTGAAQAGEPEAASRATARTGAGQPYVDLEQLIGEEMPAADTRMILEMHPSGDEQADLDVIIEAFRRGVAENIEEADFQSHYDLGVAFRQMGMLDEAIREFQLAARGTEHRERAFELMGLCFMEKGMPSVAVNCFRRGIETEHDPREALGLHYHLARSLEELGDPSGARQEYEKVIAVDVTFMDAAERLSKLG